MRSTHIHRLFGGAVVAAAAVLCPAGSARAAVVSPNTGSLGSSANGSSADAVAYSTGVVTAGSDFTAVYNNTNGVNTTVPFLSALNPATASAFTIEFWARPSASDNDDAVLGNRVSSGNRSGWAFFQRNAATGWNFRMYNGAGSATAWDITGGTATLNAWSHVVVTWNGTAPQLYVNGAPITATNVGSGGTYNPNTTVPLTVATLEDGTSPYAGAVDEVAFYGSALTGTQVANHFAAVSSPTAGTYKALVRTDGALLQLSNVPEPTSVALLGVAAGGVVLRRRRRAV